MQFRLKIVFFFTTMDNFENIFSIFTCIIFIFFFNFISLTIPIRDIEKYIGKWIMDRI